VDSAENMHSYYGALGWHNQKARGPPLSILRLIQPALQIDAGMSFANFRQVAIKSIAKRSDVSDWRR
jgi:hypothetical protein